MCAHTALTPYCGNVPKSNAIPKLSNIDPVEFTTNWTDKPFILTEPVRKWPVFSRWSEANMLAKYGDVMFRAEAVDWPLKTYVDYMSDNQDESPLYLFDRNFVEKMDLAVGTINESEYWPPECFGEDLFSVFSHERPDCRWLIVGPERSGSTFHKDPNATSAWNAVLGGSKYWIMFPSGHGVPPPPGVFVSEDQSEVTSPLSIAEWLISFHGEARKTPGCKEAVCNEGEVLHVPSGWWHLVINLSPSIAITQNFVPERQLVNVLDFLKNKSDQVSGFKDSVQDPYQLFVEKLGEQKPQTLESAMDVLAYLSRPKKRKWDMVVQEGKNGDEGRNEGFSFGFGDQDDVDVP